jgi:hypothetical protein
MQIVIKIDEDLYKSIIGHRYKLKFQQKCDYEDLKNAIEDGVQLPKGHGRLKDFDKIEWYGCTTDFDCPFRHLDCKDCERAECDKTQVDEIPTIIEADRSEEE